MREILREIASGGQPSIHPNNNCIYCRKPPDKQKETIENYFNHSFRYPKGVFCADILNIGIVHTLAKLCPPDMGRFHGIL